MWFSIAMLLVLVANSIQDKLPGSSCVHEGQPMSDGGLLTGRDPCHVCHCHRGRVSCYWKSCDPPPELCEVMEVESRCNPSLYICPIPLGIGGDTSSLQELDATVSPISRPRQISRSRGSSRSVAGRTRTSSRGSTGAARTRSRGAPRVSRQRSRGASRASPQRVLLSGADRTRFQGSPSLRQTVRRRRPAVRPEPRPQTSEPQVILVKTVQPAPAALKFSPISQPLPTVKSSSSFESPLRNLVEEEQAGQALLDIASAPAVPSSATYFNEELSVPQNFSMPRGRGEGPRSPLPVSSTIRPPLPVGARFRFASSTTTTTPAPRAERRRAGRFQAPSASQRRIDVSLPPPDQSFLSETDSDEPTSRGNRQFLEPTTDQFASPPLISFDYDLDEDIDLSDFIFPEFGQRLKRSLDEKFDAETVRELLDKRRRRRSLLPGDDGHHQHHHHDDRHDPDQRQSPADACIILGVRYQLGEVIGVASDNCLECRCAAQSMYCSPKCCFYALEERPLRQGRGQQSGQKVIRQPHPLSAYLAQ